MALETARDNEIGNSTFPHPFGFAHEIHSMMIYASGERMVTLAWCLNTDPPHVFSGNELARAAAEAATAGTWLGAEQADGDRRIRRLLGLLSISNEDETRLRHALNLDAEAEGGTQLIL
jgi:hypothetical protein